MNRKNLKAKDVRKRPEKIKLTEKEYFKIFDNSVNGIIILDAQNEKIEDVNKIFAKMLGRAKKKFAGKKLWEIGAFIDPEKAKKIVKCIKKKKLFCLEDVFLKNGKETINVELTGHLHGIDHQKIIQLNIRDITLKKEGETMIKKSEEKFREIFDDCPELIIVIDGKGVILEANKLVDKWLKYKRNDIVGKNIVKLDFLTLKSKKIVVDKIKKRFSKKPIKPYELEFINKKGEIRIALISGNLMKGEREGEWRDLIFVNDITEQKQARKKIEESEEKFKNIFNNSRDGILLADTKTRNLVIGNEAVCRMLGYSAKELSGLSVDDIHPKKDLPYVLGQFRKQVQGKIKLAEDMPVKRKDGSAFYAEITASPVSFGEKKYIIGTFRDTTEKRRADEEVKKLSAIAKYSAELVNMASPKGEMIFLNEAGSRMLGINNEEVKKYNILGVIPEHLHPLVKKELLPSLAKGKTWEGELQYINIKTKKLIDVHATTFPIRDEKTGRIICFANIALDITERKKIEEAINREKAKDDAILAGLGEGLIIVGNDEKIQYVNEAAEAMLGWRNEEIKGKPFFGAVKIVDEKDLPFQEGARPLEIAIKTGKKVFSKLSDGLHYVKKDKTVFPVSITISPIALKGKLAGFVNVFRDITREKDIDKVKTEFVSLTSHQLRTPITSINWNAEMLLNGDAGSINSKQKELLKEIYDSNKRMTNLINALLNVSRLELETFIVEPEAVDVAGVVRHNLQEMALMIKTNKIEIAEKYDPEVKTLMADPKLLDIIIQNLLSNAIKYTKDGKVEVETKRSDGHIILKVSDNGIGIPKAQQKNIYTKLFRADNAKVKDADGTGLGLYIVKLILEACGGKIWFKSEEGKGTDFYVSLPASGMKKKEGVKKLI